MKYVYFWTALFGSHGIVFLLGRVWEHASHDPKA